MRVQTVSVSAASCNDTSKHKNRISRRSFGKSAVTGALAAVAQPSGVARDSGSASSSGQQDEQADLTPVQMQEVEARFKETIRRYGDRLSEDQRDHIRRVLIQNERMLAPIRDFALSNGDEPALTLKLRVEKSEAAALPPENGEMRSAPHAR